MVRRKKSNSRNKRLSRLTQRLMLAGVACVIVLFGFLSNRYHLFERVFRYNITLGKNYPVRGIDISKYNGSVDFKKVADDDISFVYIKASEGVTVKSSSIKSNAKKAREAGLKVGAYHFFRMNRDGGLQAENFMAAVKGVHMDMPMVIDVEDWTNVRTVSRSVVNDRIKVMVNTLKRNGYRVMIYTNGDGKKHYYDVSCKGLDLWLCTFSHPDDVKGKGHVMQQYSHWGRVDGIEGSVDLDVFMGSRSEWKAWLRQND